MKKNNQNNIKQKNKIKIIFNFISINMIKNI